jgi:hypothetical protein
MVEKLRHSNYVLSKLFTALCIASPPCKCLQLPRTRFLALNYLLTSSLSASLRLLSWLLILRSLWPAALLWLLASWLNCCSSRCSSRSSSQSSRRLSSLYTDLSDLNDLSLPEKGSYPSQLVADHQGPHFPALDQWFVNV